VQGVAGVVVGSATAVDVEVSRNTVKGYQKTGIVAYGTAAVNADILDNVVAGAGPITTTAQNGVQMSNGASGTIQRNDVSGNNYTPASVCATGVLVLSNGVLVRGNDLAANLCDIFAQANGTIVEGNNIPAAYLKKGMCFIELGKRDEALSVFKLLISKYPNDEETKIAQEKIKELTSGHERH